MFAAENGCDIIPVSELVTEALVCVVFSKSHCECSGSRMTDGFWFDPGRFVC